MGRGGRDTYARTRIRRTPGLSARTRTQPPTHNVLAISDLHLGDALRRNEPRPLSPPLDAPLAAFLDHYAQAREDGRPWRLLIVGDMVDFIAITAAPPPGEAPFDVTEFERACGLEPEPLKARWKLEQVIAYHHRFFDALARFIAMGHEVVIIRGNHDASWCFAEVQNCLRETLEALVSPDPGFRARLRFEDWFHLEPGRVYAEHGHHYDEYSVTDDLMRRPDARGRLSEPVSTLAFRYFGNRHPRIDLSDVDRWRMLDYIRWAHREGGLVRYFLDYVGMSARVCAFVLKASVRTMLGSVGGVLRTSKALAVERGRVAHVRALLRGVRRDHGRLAREIAALMKPPASGSVWATARMLYFDRVVLLLGVGAIGCGCIAVEGPRSARWGVFSAVAGLAALANAWLDRTRLVASHPKLRAVAHRVSVLFGVPVVIMGHSHRQVNERVGEDARYLNLGTWLGQDASGFPHAAVTARGAEFRHFPAKPVRASQPASPRAAPAPQRLPATAGELAGVTG